MASTAERVSAFLDSPDDSGKLAILRNAFAPSARMDPDRQSGPVRVIRPAFVELSWEIRDETWLDWPRREIAISLGVNHGGRWIGRTMTPTVTDALAGAPLAVLLFRCWARLSETR